MNGRMQYVNEQLTYCLSFFFFWFVYFKNIEKYHTYISSRFPYRIGGATKHCTMYRRQVLRRNMFFFCRFRSFNVFITFQTASN